MNHAPSIAVLFAIAELSFSGIKCTKDEPQEYLEFRLASKIAQVLSLQQAATDQSVWFTNLLQITSLMTTQALAGYEEKFATLYGKNAGFTNSLLEKYQLLPGGVITPTEGSIILVSSHPIKRRSGSVDRVFVSKYSSRFVAGWITEDLFQESLRRAGIRLSDLPQSGPLPSMRHLADPTGERAAAWRAFEKEHDRDVAELRRLHTPPFWQRTPWQIGGLVTLVLLILGAFWYVERSRRH